MSADNYWLVRSHPDGGFTYQMAFASDEDLPALREGREYPRHETAEAAACAAIMDDWTEYGIVFLMSDPAVHAEVAVTNES